MHLQVLNNSLHLNLSPARYSDLFNSANFIYIFRLHKTYAYNRAHVSEYFTIRFKLVL